MFKWHKKRDFTFDPATGRVTYKKGDINKGTEKEKWIKLDDVVAISREGGVDGKGFQKLYVEVQQNGGVPKPTGKQNALQPTT